MGFPRDVGNQRRADGLRGLLLSVEDHMRLVLAAFCVVIGTAAAMAQSEPNKPGDSPHSEGRTTLPDDNKGQLQPQGWTGPITSGSGGSSAASPQGQSPPGMQAAPDGSSKSVVDPNPQPK
jgi:hypothetical protein